MGLTKFVIPPPEDYNRFWGKPNYTGKVVLDIGADYGSTACFFLQRGAFRVIAVESNKHLFSRLLENAPKLGNIIPVELHVSSIQDYINLIQSYKPDIVKVDCEGCEIYLLDVPDSILRNVREYIIEIHSDHHHVQFLTMFQRYNFDIIHEDNWTKSVWIIYARMK